MLQDALYFFRSDLIFSLLHHDRAAPPPRLPDYAPYEVTHAEINIAQAASHSPMRPDKSPVANLFGGSLGFTLNKRQSIEREKSGHTPARKKHGHTTCRASSVRARVAIQEALSVKI